jgi:carboxyl-terminal processing protease
METKPKTNAVRSIIIGFVVLILVACSFGGGVAVGHFLPLGTTTNQVTSTVPTTTTGTTTTDTTTLFKPFWEAWDIIHQQYVDQPVDDTKLMQGAINGMMQSLGDPHSTYMDPQTYKDATAELAGSYAGIGAYVDTSGTILTVIKPVSVDSPAAKAGLQAGDQIIAVDGTYVTGMDPSAVRQKVLGPEGTTVTLTIQRGDQAPFDVTITRAVITIPSVTSKMLDNNIAYIQITTFGDNTAQDFHDQLKLLMAQNPKGIILDLRDNPGGLLDVAVTIASEFIPSGTIVTEKLGDGTEQPHGAISGGLATDKNLPVVVLINGYSASASEIVAGALQDTGRAKLVGEQSYGKGSAQYWIPLSNDEGAVRITIAHWLTPNGRLIDKKGLTPDVVVALTQDDFKAGKDPQLDAALALFSK